ncbi:hypothetical protein ACIFOT_15765 [Neobacillus sp. NRS-1170]|uniref:hypothetical protein n=1 Tax=Neobacillus sp. NRS-1170 TaxID=3233898 RepID=UPI003D2D6E37
MEGTGIQTYDGTISPELKDLRQSVKKFIDEKVIPAESIFEKGWCIEKPVMLGYTTDPMRSIPFPLYEIY